MSVRQHYRRRRPSRDTGNGSFGIAIRVGSRRNKQRFHEISVQGPRDAVRFARMVDDQTRAHPRDPLVININGYQPWLGDVIHSCIDDYWSDISDLDRSVQYGGVTQFPEKASKRGRNVPWTFIIDHMNVPQVYYWSVGMNPPEYDDRGLPRMEDFRFRTGVWFCAQGACRFNPQVSVTIIFTCPTPVCEAVVTQLLFSRFWGDEDLDQPREDEEGICWTFIRLSWLLTDWQNIVGEVRARLDEAEFNSHGRRLPVKTRTRRMHNEVERIYEMKEFVNFHTRALKKLQKLKNDVPKDQQSDPLWVDMDDEVEDLEQAESTLDSLKERFNNLIELEFNITNAVQADNSAFLSAVATLFLPVSFLASLFGMTTVNWPAIWYLWAAIPVFVVSAAFTAIFPWARRRVQNALYPIEEYRLRLRPNQFTMLGDELPDNVNAPSESRSSRVLHRRNSWGDGLRLDSQSRRSPSRRSQSRRSQSRRSQSRRRSEKLDERQ